MTLKKGKIISDHKAQKPRTSQGEGEVSVAGHMTDLEADDNTLETAQRAGLHTDPNSDNAINIDFSNLRKRMVDDQLRARGIQDERVLKAMSEVPREKFLPPAIRGDAYLDVPRAIGFQQTISQPFVVARMCELLDLQGHEKVLDVGTGSGYEAAILAELVDQVITIEIIKELADEAEKVLKEMNYENVTVVVGDGYQGVPSSAPFDAIKSAAQVSEIPDTWKNQLVEGGRIVAPVGESVHQRITRVTKSKLGFDTEQFEIVRFVPLVTESK